MADKLTAEFEFERDTKNTRRYSEVAVGAPPFCNTIYLQRWALERLGGGRLPDRVRVTVQVVDGD